MTLGFAYDEEGPRREIVLAGALQPSPFRTWSFEIADGIDLSSCKGLALRVDCDATVLE